MSMRNWTVDGYGIDISYLDGVDNATKIAFIKQHDTKTYADYEAYAKEAELDMEADLTEILNYCNETADGFAYVFAGVMYDETDIMFTSEVNDETGEGAVLYMDRAPWEIEDKVRGMSEDDMKAIFAKYLAELGVTEFYFDRQSIEFWG